MSTYMGSLLHRITLSNTTQSRLKEVSGDDDTDGMYYFCRGITHRKNHLQNSTPVQIDCSHFRFPMRSLPVGFPSSPGKSAIYFREERPRLGTLQRSFAMLFFPMLKYSDASLTVIKHF